MAHKGGWGVVGNRTWKLPNKEASREYEGVRDNNHKLRVGSLYCDKEPNSGEALTAYDTKPMTEIRKRLGG
jgi:hypothetical protein